MLCPCGTSNAYEECCEPLILKKVNAGSPEKLMRSRYSAYALQQSNYIFDTYSRVSQKDLVFSDIDIWAKDTQWLNLMIINVSEFININKPTVEFEAIYENDGDFYKMREVSTFVKESNMWRYLDGKNIKHLEIPKPQRNEKCICLSGKKYKVCCSK